MKLNDLLAGFLIITALFAGGTLPLKAQNAWFNEFHYDNVGDDTLEFIEVVIEHPEDFNLSLFSVVLYNGATTVRAPYDTKTLNLSTTGATIGNFTFYSYQYPQDGIQNGYPDGMVLVYDDNVIPGQFLSYEGSFTAASGPAQGMTSVNIGVSENGTTTIGYSLQLSGNGAEYSDFSWQSEAPSTTGILNNGQTLFSSGADNPVNFNAFATSTTSIGLSWDLNANFDSVFIAYSDTNVFGTPSGAYNINDPVAGGGSVLYKGSGITASHAGLAMNSVFYYKAWSKDTTGNYSSGVTDSAATQSQEPTSHPNGITAVSNGPSHITVSWNDSDADHYLIKGNNSGYSFIVPPVDGIAQADSLLVKNVADSVQVHQFSGLVPSATYYFKIYPYNGTGVSSNYKTNGTIPQATAMTKEPDLDLIITEVADPGDKTYAKFVEIMNTSDSTLDFSTIAIYLSRQAHTGSWTDLQLTGTLASGSTRAIAHSDTSFLNNYGLTASQYDSFVISGNGNDGYYLFLGGNHSTGALVDAYGVLNQDGTGKAWDYENAHAVRKRAIISPKTSWDSTEWIILPSDVKAMTPFYHKGVITWQGTTSANWNTKGNNWNSPNGYIPDASCNVIIPFTTIYPIITEPSSCNQVQIQSGSTLSIQSTGSLLIAGP
jgi:hypothetical protein